MVALFTLGFCKEELNELGPVQLYVAPPTGVVLNEMVPPKHTGLLADAAGVAGMGFTVTVTTTGVPAQAPEAGVTV